MAVQIKKYSPTKKDLRLKVLVAGGAGYGKTTFGATACNPLFICGEKWLLTLAGSATPDYIDVPTLDKLRETVSWLRKEKPDYDTLVVDSISEIAEWIRRSMTNGGETVLSQREWGILSDKIMSILHQLVDLDYNIIFLAHTQEKDDEAGNTFYDIAIPGGARQLTPRIFDIIAYIWVDKEGNRSINVKENSYSRAKCRSQALRKVDNLPFNFCEWVDLVTEGTTVVETEEIVAEIETPTNEAPTEKVKEMRDAVEKILLKDRSEAAKSPLREKASTSDKIGDEEKQRILNMIDTY